MSQASDFESLHDGVQYAAAAEEAVSGGQISNPTDQKKKAPAGFRSQ